MARRRHVAAARASFLQALKLEDSAPTRYNLGFILETSGDAPSALAQYERAIQLDPTLEPAATGLARLRSAR